LYVTDMVTALGLQAVICWAETAAKSGDLPLSNGANFYFGTKKEVDYFRRSVCLESSCVPVAHASACFACRMSG